MNNAPQDFVNLVSSYLPWIDRQMICNNSDLFNKAYSDKLLLADIHRALNAYGISDTRGFCDALHKHSQLISGSFLVQVLLGEDWKPNDLDIIGKYSEADEFIFWIFDTFGTTIMEDRKPKFKRKLEVNGNILWPIPRNLPDNLRAQIQDRFNKSGRSFFFDDYELCIMINRSTDPPTYKSMDTLTPCISDSISYRIANSV
jgi:hypothetical protein